MRDEPSIGTNDQIVIEDLARLFLDIKPEGEEDVN